MKIPYGRQSINKDDFIEVLKSLNDELITTGPKVEEFEKEFAKKVGSKYAIALSSGTAALHLACLAIGLKEGDELITTPMTFAASANCALYCRAKPIFADITAQGLISPEEIEKAITQKTKAIIPVHYSGLPCNMKAINAIAKKHNLKVIEDACHALGARYNSSTIGDCAYSDLAVFSFHPVKHITTGEGGMITTNSEKLYKRLKQLRTHGITRNKEELLNKNEGSWYYEMQTLGFNYRLTDFQSALGLSQLHKLDKFVQRRRAIAEKYNQELKQIQEIELIKENTQQFNAYHLYVIKLNNKETRKKLFDYLKENEIFCQVHYLPVYLHPFYQKLGYPKGLCQNSEAFYNRIISLPIYPELTTFEQDYVIKKIKEFFRQWT